MDNLYYLKFSFDCIILGFCKNVVLLTLGKLLSSAFLLGKGKNEINCFINGRRKNELREKRWKVITKTIQCSKYASEHKF